MLLKHFFIEKIAHSSYLLAGAKTCAVIDPSRDVDIYLREARSRGLRITHILETHLHADFISGHLDLARATGAKICAPGSAGCAFDHEPLVEGDTVEIEGMLLRVLETPGHTPEHIAYVVVDRSRGDEPIGVFCGDTLFVGDVGRPDLFPDNARELAGRLFHSLHDKLLRLPDFCEIYPAHGAGSLCGRSVGAKYRSTIGYERRFNRALLIESKEEFIRSLTTDMPPTPDHFGRCSEINRRGPALIEDLPPLRPLEPAAFRAAIDDSTIVLDVRSYDAFGSQHVPMAMHIDLGGNFPTFAGWVLPPDARIMLVAEGPEQAETANLWARRVGVDGITHYLDGGMFAWAVHGMPTAHLAHISARELHDMMGGAEGFTLIDVRSRVEFDDHHIEGAINVPAPDLRHRHEEFDRRRTTVLICSTGHRSSLGASILQRHYFERVINAAGGMKGYSAAGFARECLVCDNPHGSRFSGATDSSGPRRGSGG
ncbi:MAG: MBL fold metallo-hydrolase [Candidatus Krumholzibacteria bacterium]|nr:MBL fold metallo-hydrolase [Candidatus Krumholzibacteria bacterium]